MCRAFVDLGNLDDQVLAAFENAEGEVLVDDCVLDERPVLEEVPVAGVVHDFLGSGEDLRLSLHPIQHHRQQRLNRPLINNREMRRPLNLRIRLVVEPPNQATTRLDQRHLNTRGEFLLLHHQYQLVVNIALKQGLVLLRMPLLRLISHLASDLINCVEWMVHQVENIAHDGDGVLDTRSWQLHGIIILVDYVGLIHVENLDLITECFTESDGQILLAVAGLVEDAEYFDVKRELSKIEFLVD